MKRVICRGGGDPVIKECVSSTNGGEKTAVIAGDYYPEDYPEGDNKRIWGPHYQSFERWVKEIAPDCHIISRDTPTEEAILSVSRSEAIAIEGGFPDRYINWMINKKIFTLIKRMFLKEDNLQELWTLSAGSISLCKEVRYFVIDDESPQRVLQIDPKCTDNLTPLELKGEPVLETRTGLGIIPKTIISPHSTQRKEKRFARMGFFRGYNGAFVFLGDDGVMEVFYDKKNGTYKPVDVHFDGYHRIKFGGEDIDKEAYLKIIGSASRRN